MPAMGFLFSGDKADLLSPKLPGVPRSLSDPVGNAIFPEKKKKEDDPAVSPAASVYPGYASQVPQGDLADNEQTILG